MLFAIGGFVAFCVLCSYLTTTPQQRTEQRARFARWNPLFIAIIIIGLGIIFYPWPSTRP